MSKVSKCNEGDAFDKGDNNFEPPAHSVGREVQVPKDSAAMLEQKEEHIVESKQRDGILELCLVDLIQPVEELGMWLISEKEDFPLLDGEKVQQESKILEGTHVVKSEFDASATYQPFMVHEVKRLDEVDKLDTIVLLVDQDKAISFTTLVPPIDLIIPNKFNDMVEHKASFFLALPKVVQELVQVSHARVLILKHLKT